MLPANGAPAARRRSRRPAGRPLALAAALVLAAGLPARSAATPPAADPPAVLLPGPLPAPDAAELRLALERLTVLGTALHVGAHPDDENTALLAYLAQGRLVRTAYLSLTRGDGGQNLIGSEAGDLLGVIRTQELLAARRIDGAEQLFTQAVDFGYSKSPEEALSVWNREAVLSDVVRAIREARPDVVVTRFPTDGRGGHGHHTASAILAVEAFEAAGDPARFPEQLSRLAPWRPRRLLWNAFRPSPEELAADPLPLSLDLGAFNPLLGRSYTEIAAESRSQHKSQGFGAAARRGSRPETFLHLAGEPARGDLFDGVDLTWRRIEGGERVGSLLVRAVERFEPERPSAVVPLLLDALDALDSLAREAPRPDPWLEFKRAELLEVIRAASGLWLEAIAAEPEAASGGSAAVTATAILRSPGPWRLLRVEALVAGRRPPAAEVPAAAEVGVAEAIPVGAGRGETAAAPAGGSTPRAPLGSAGRRGAEIESESDLEENRPLERRLTVPLPSDLPLSQPYWLREPRGPGRFEVSDAALAGSPEAPPALSVRFDLSLLGREVAYEVPVLYRWTDPVLGERHRPLAIVPRVAVDLDREVAIFPSAEPRTMRATLRSGAPGVSGILRLLLPAGWRTNPETISFTFAEAGEEEAIAFTVTPPAAESSGSLRAVAEVGGSPLGRGALTLDYPHIPPQALSPPAEARLVRLDLAAAGRQIGYVRGAGDEVPGALSQIGYEVTQLSDADLEAGDLSRFDAVVLGIRAYNTRKRLAQANPRLLAYVAAGGTLVVQYNTAGDLATDRLGPFPFELSRDRVTVEGAPVTLRVPGHPLLNIPHRISPADFEGWVQERGLYFPGTWDERYETVLALADPGEQPLAGGILFARHGRGTYVYTSLAFFRQLPAGVPGALRLFVNLLSARP